MTRVISVKVKVVLIVTNLNDRLDTSVKGKVPVECLYVRYVFSVLGAVTVYHSITISNQLKPYTLVVSLTLH
jgi:hypothetical protein